MRPSIEGIKGLGMVKQAYLDYFRIHVLNFLPREAFFHLFTLITFEMSPSQFYQIL